MTTILIIIGIVQAFLSGIHAAEWEYAGTRREKMQVIGIALVMLGIGILCYALACTYLLLRFVIKKVDSQLQFRFLYDFYFTQKYNNLNKELLKKLNKEALSMGNSIPDRIFIKCVDMINNRNNYIYEKD